MAEGSYRQFCPVAMAAEMLCTRWTVVLLRELVAGSTRFNELRRGVPRMSPALLSQRLKDLEAAGIVAREASRSDAGAFEYRLTASGRELGPIVEAFGIWGQRRIDADLSLQHLDVQLLMWDMRRNLNTTPMPQRRNVIQFLYPELPAAQRSWWLIVDPKDDVDLCSSRTRVRRRSLCVRRPAHHDRDLDGARYGPRRRGKQAYDFDRRPPHRFCHANLARAQSVCKREKTRKLTASTVPELEAV